MAGYITIDKTTRDDPRLLELTEALLDVWTLEQDRDTGSDAICDAICYAARDALLGALVRLWCYADEHVRDDNTLPIKLSTLARELRFPEEVLRRFPTDWLIIGANDSVKLPGYVEKNGLISRTKRREQARERMRRFRAKRDADVTEQPTRNGASQGAFSHPTPIPSQPFRDLREEGAQKALSKIKEKIAPLADSKRLPESMR